uniref:Uncharacterized protein n=1 Tax=Citrifermentans bremense TaxID=60035 RepID=A0A6S6M2I7_9BACT
MIADADTDRERLAVNDIEELLPFFFGELLGVVDPGEEHSGGKYNCGGHDRPRQRSSAGLVNPRYPAVAATKRLRLEG